MLKLGGVDSLAGIRTDRALVMLVGATNRASERLVAKPYKHQLI